MSVQSSKKKMDFLLPKLFFFPSRRFGARKKIWKKKCGPPNKLLHVAVQGFGKKHVKSVKIPVKIPNR